MISSSEGGHSTLAAFIFGEDSNIQCIPNLSKVGWFPTEFGAQTHTAKKYANMIEIWFCFTQSSFDDHPGSLEFCFTVNCVAFLKQTWQIPGRF